MSFIISRSWFMLKNIDGKSAKCEFPVAETAYRIHLSQPPFRDSCSDSGELQPVSIIKSTRELLVEALV